MQKWEYLSVTTLPGEIYSINGERPETKILYLDYLAQKGAEGWELISVINTESGRDLVFKRPSN